MNIVVDINHPAQVHFFKNFIKIMKEQGHKVLVTATKKDVNLTLLNNYNIEYINLGTYGKSLAEKMIKLPLIDYKMFKEIKEFKPDILCGVGSIRVAHVAKILNRPSINFDDTETQSEQHILYVPFTSHLFTPNFYLKKFGSNQYRYNGYHQLAYLHPKYYKPDPTIIEELKLNKEEMYTVVRFVSFNATHDIGKQGIIEKINLVKELEKFGRVFISSEGTLNKKLEKNVLKIPPQKLHDLLYYASLYIGDGGTTASEAATLGTYSIFINSNASKLGLFHELNKYGVLDYYNEDKNSINIAKAILERPNIKEKTKQKSEKMINEKISVTDFLMWFINNYPSSIEKLSNEKGEK